jgi:hypothetical protein
MRQLVLVVLALSFLCVTANAPERTPAAEAARSGQHESPLEGPQRRLDQIHEAAHKEGFGSSVSDPEKNSGLSGPPAPERPTLPIF